MKKKILKVVLQIFAVCLLITTFVLYILCIFWTLSALELSEVPRKEFLITLTLSLIHEYLKAYIKDVHPFPFENRKTFGDHLEKRTRRNIGMTGFMFGVFLFINFKMFILFGVVFAFIAIQIYKDLKKRQITLD